MAEIRDSDEEGGAEVGRLKHLQSITVSEQQSCFWGGETGSAESIR